MWLVCLQCIVCMFTKYYVACMFTMYSVYIHNVLCGLYFCNVFCVFPQNIMWLVCLQNIIWPVCIQYINMWLLSLITNSLVRFNNTGQTRLIPSVKISDFVAGVSMVLTV